MADKPPVASPEQRAEALKVAASLYPVAPCESVIAAAKRFAAYLAGEDK
jgi:hypothetical protein